MPVVGSRIRADRERKLMTLRELSAKSGVARDNISDIETGRTKRPHPSTLRKLAAVLEVDPARWFDDAP